MAVYFVQAGIGGPIKIGFAGWSQFKERPEAESVAARVDKLRHANHEELRLLGWMPGEWTDEAPVHRRFAHLLVRGEWYRPGPDLLAFLADHCDTRPLERTRGPRSVGACRVCRDRTHDARNCPARADRSHKFRPVGSSVAVDPFAERG